MRHIDPPDPLWAPYTDKKLFEALAWAFMQWQSGDTQEEGAERFAARVFDMVTAEALHPVLLLAMNTLHAEFPENARVRAALDIVRHYADSTGA